MLSLKAALLHIGNKCRSFPTALAVHMKRSYDIMHILVEHIQCESDSTSRFATRLYEILLFPLWMRQLSEANVKVISQRNNSHFDKH
jgi:hypothetical protein